MQKTRAADASEIKELISFTVGSEEYGLELFRVKEVIRVPRITWLPKAPRFVKGIISLRGQVIPIVDLREKFGLPPAEQTGSTRIIVVEMNGRSVGVVVDATSQVVRVPTADIEAGPPVMGRTAGEYITGVAKRDEELIVLIDLDKLLGTEEMMALEYSLSQTTARPARCET